MNLGPRRRLSDPVAVTVHGLLVTTSMVQYAVLPLLPAVQQDFSLSAKTVSLLLALPSLIMVITAIPAGWLSDRVGPARVTFASAIILVVSCVLQVLPSLFPFLMGRFLYGLAYTAIWTSGPAWLSQSRSGSSGRVGAVVTSAAAGSIAGPFVAGVLADRFGLGSPFVVFAVISAVLAVASAAGTRTGPAPSQGPAGLTSVAAEMLGSRELVAALGALVAVGAVSGAVQLLVPLQLHQSGSSTASLGAVLSVAGLVYVVASAGTARARSGTVTSGAAVLGCVVLALTVVPAAFTASSLVLIGSLIAVTLPRAQLNTLGYRLATRSVSAEAATLGRVVGVLNLVWAISMSLGPIAAAWLTDGAGLRAAFLATAAWPALIALLLAAFLTARPRRRGSLSLAPPGEVTT
ncbi:MAG: MFS transporter [Nocardioidaceae bacterium]